MYSLNVTLELEWDRNFFIKQLLTNHINYLPEPASSPRSDLLLMQKNKRAKCGAEKPGEIAIAIYSNSPRYGRSCHRE